MTRTQIEDMEALVDAAKASESALLRACGRAIRRLLDEIGNLQYLLRVNDLGPRGAPKPAKERT